MVKKKFFQKRGLAGYRVSSPGRSTKEFSTLKEAKNHAMKYKVARIFKVNVILDYFK